MQQIGEDKRQANLCGGRSLSAATTFVAPWAAMPLWRRSQRCAATQFCRTPQSSVARLRSAQRCCRLQRLSLFLFRTSGLSRLELKALYNARLSRCRVLLIGRSGSYHPCRSRLSSARAPAALTPSHVFFLASAAPLLPESSSCRNAMAERSGMS